MKPLGVVNPLSAQREQAAFTFTELLVVLGVVAVLALLSVSALAHIQASSDRAGCANNLRRLMQAWQMYADDYSGRLMAHASSGGNLPWVSGNLDFSPSNPDNTDPVKLTNVTFAAIGAYVNSSSWFRCPADPTTIVFASGPKLRVRSYSMSDLMGSPTPSFWSPTYVVMTNLAQVPQPNRIFVLLEEHPGGIGDSSMAIDLEHVGGSAGLVDFPAAFHLGGANLAMADGHVEYWQWADARTMPPVNTSPILLNVSSPNNPDVARLQAAASYRP